MRAGRYVKQPSGYSAFVPANLPPKPPIKMDPKLIRLLSDAHGSLCRLDGVASVLPNIDLFVAMYVRQEAVLSSQIEGTQSTLENFLEFEVDARGKGIPKDVEEVVNYVRAMNYGLNRLTELPLSLRLIREIHEILLEGVRGGDRTPGEFRRSQNWIGPAGATINAATYIPPPVHEMKQALHNFETFLHDKDSYHVLVHAGLAHAQFETIHPFLDGNGRVGRLLITFLLCEKEVLHQPLLYLSSYLKAHRAEYYDRLTAIRTDGDWEGWLRFFLTGIYEVSESATKTARTILALRGELQGLILESMAGNAMGFRLLDHLFEHPLTNIQLVAGGLNCAYLTASKLVTEFADLGILRETTGQKRNRRYIFSPYVQIFAEPFAPQLETKKKTSSKAAKASAKKAGKQGKKATRY